MSIMVTPFSQQSRMVSFLFGLCLILSIKLSAQTKDRISTRIIWSPNNKISRSESVFAEKYLDFEGALHNSTEKDLPIWERKIPLTQNSNIEVRLENAVYETFDPGYTSSQLEGLLSEIQINTKVQKARNKYSGFLQLIPIIKTGGQFQRLTQFDLVVQTFPIANLNTSSRSAPPEVSKLADGQIFKISVNNEGVHKLDLNFFNQSLGLDMTSIDARKIQILGNEGGPLRQEVGTPRTEDLAENSIYFKGGGDGSFDEGDYILFYAHGPNRVEFNASKNVYQQITNPYSDKKYYFIKIGSEDGLRMHDIPSAQNGEITIQEFDHHLRLEENTSNILKVENNAQGSGQNWYGELFLSTRSKTYNFNIPNITASPIFSIEASLMARAATTSNFSLNINGTKYTSPGIGPISFGSLEQPFAKPETILESLPSFANKNVTITIDYPAVGDGTNKAWLDYIEINALRKLIATGNSMTFRNRKTLDISSSKWVINNADNYLIWDITDPNIVGIQMTEGQGSNKTWNANHTTGTLKKYVAVNVNGHFPIPELESKIENQNLHAINKADYIIIYHNDFKAQALRLADHRTALTDYTIELVEINSIFNEFGSGAVDPIAIRDFVKMVYDRDPKFRYLCLFGDASFDYKNVYGAGENFIPTFESKSGVDPISGYPTDDYFGLLDVAEGSSAIDGAIDIGIRRIPVSNITEAKVAVDKVIHYDLSKKTLKDWRNRLVFVCDDEDTNQHFDDTEEVYSNAKNLYKKINIEKIYLDAYPQVSTSGGARFPLATDAFNRSMFKGALVVNYFGHGGPTGWAQERVVTLKDIASWTNFDQLPLFVTATCSFTGFDDAGKNTAGELTLLNPKGGAVALFSTVRAVYANQNRLLVSSVFDHLLESSPELQGNKSIGDILRISKNESDASNENSRKFGLFGDPSLQLNVPKLNVQTTKVNGIPVVNNSIIDTIGALQKVSIEGILTDENGLVLNNFNGRVFPTVYDKTQIARTLGQDNINDATNFDIQNSIVFKGQATVNNGAFSFSFVVPKDINYAFGLGRLSYYAENGTQIDANGLYEGITIGGAVAQELDNDAPPLVDIFMNDEAFVSGGLTDENPVVLVKLVDDYGINIAGSAIGHDLTGVLDGDTNSKYILNDFYEAELDDYRSGMVKFPLFNISPGKHSLEVTAWDVGNNSAKGSIEFFVSENGKAALGHVLNYPNPFTTKTNFQFEHNMNGQELDVLIHVFSGSGKLVKTIQEHVLPANNEGNLVNDIEWDGKDDFGDQLAKGVYVYKVKVRNTAEFGKHQSIESDFEKLVILK